MSLLLPCPGCLKDRRADEGHRLCRECEGYAPSIDFESLLKRYLKLVATQEGVSFTGGCLDQNPLFTEEEVATLRRLDDEAWA